MMEFESKKFCRISTLGARWDMSTRRIYDLLSKGVISAWHPEGLIGVRGVMIDVRSVLIAEERGRVKTE